MLESRLLGRIKINASPLAKNGPALLSRIDPPDRRLTEDRARS